MSGDFYKEWRSNAAVDYYPLLILLWLSTNSWYRSHYSEITTKRDRDFLDKLRNDHSTRNKLFARFDKLLQAGGTKAHVELYNHLEGLFFALNQTVLLWDENTTNSGMTFENCLLSSNPKSFGTLRVKSFKTDNGDIKLNDTLSLTSDKSVLFNGLLEIIYQVRCQLVHGQIEPNNENHEVVKYSYLLLQDLMSF